MQQVLALWAVASKCTQCPSDQWLPEEEALVSFVAIGVLWTDRAVGCAHLHHACLTVSKAGCWHAHCARVAVSSRAIADTHAHV